MTSNITGKEKFVFVLLEEPNAQLVLIPAHIVTACFLCRLAKTIVQKAPLSHPVFAVAFQEVIVLILCELVCLCVLTAIACGNPLDLTFAAYVEPPLLALQFHQVSWLLITALRSYLIISENDMDLSKLTGKCCMLVWCIAVPYNVLCHFPAYTLFTVNNWPEVRIKSLDSKVLMLTMVLTNIVYNVPDLISVALYLKMWHKLRCHNTVSPQAENTIERYGGIWVGGDFDYPPNDNDANSNSSDMDSDDHDDKAESVLSKLGLHVSVALLDMLVFFVASRNIGSIVGRVLLHMHIVMFCFWIPFIVIKNNFKQLH